MRSFLLIAIMCLGSLLAAGQASAPQAPTAATPKAAPTPGQKPGSQAAPAEKSPSAKPQGPESKEVGPDAAVITIPGICLTPAPKAASSKAAGGTAAAKPPACETVVTRKQLELLIATVRPNLQPAQRRTLAQQYVELLAMSNAALQAGIEKDPKVQEQIRLSRLQILATSYSREMQQKEADVPQADIEKYYKEHAGQYEQAKLLRIYIPMVAEEGKPTDTAASKALAEKIQQSAASGEDFDKLQKEAFTASNSKGTPPPADLGERRRGTLPPKQEEAVFALKVGDVSPAIEEASGYFIYKVVSKDPVPLDRVRDEIKGMLAREHLRERMEKVRTSAKPIFNDAYFGKETQPAAAGELAPHPPAPSPQTPAPATPATPAPGTPEAPKTPPPAPPQVK